MLTIATTIFLPFYYTLMLSVQNNVTSIWQIKKLYVNLQQRIIKLHYYEEDLFTTDALGIINYD